MQRGITRFTDADSYGIRVPEDKQDNRHQTGRARHALILNQQAPRSPPGDRGFFTSRIRTLMLNFFGQLRCESKNSTKTQTSQSRQLYMRRFLSCRAVPAAHPGEGLDRLCSHLVGGLCPSPRIDAFDER